MTEPRMRRARGHGLELQIAEWGHGDKAVICVHGLTANCRSFDVVARALSHHRRVIALDLRGRGLSDKPKKGYSVDRHCEDIRAMMDDLSLGPCAVMGHSLGAIIALNFAARWPGRVDHLVLVDGAGKLTRAQTSKVFAGIKPSLDRLGKVFPSFDDYVAAIRQAPFLHPWNDALTRYFSYEVEEVTGGVRSRVSPAHIHEEILNMSKLDTARLYPMVRCPTLILRAPMGMLAKNDILLPRNAVKKMVGEIEKAWLAEMAGTNHYSIMFQPNRARDSVTAAFLDT